MSEIEVPWWNQAVTRSGPGCGGRREQRADVSGPFQAGSEAAAGPRAWVGEAVQGGASTQGLQVVVVSGFHSALWGAVPVGVQGGSHLTF